MSKVLVMGDNAFMGSRNARNASTVKTKNLPKYEEADIVIYIGRNGRRLLKSPANSSLEFLED